MKTNTKPESAVIVRPVRGRAARRHLVKDSVMVTRQRGRGGIFRRYNVFFPVNFIYCNLAGNCSQREPYCNHTPKSEGRVCIICTVSKGLSSAQSTIMQTS